jgi:peptide/nickel transport system permease protein
LAPPSLSHPFGIDNNGFDVFTRVVYAARVDVFVAVTATLLAFVVGSGIGILAGQLQGRAGPSGWVAELLMRGLDLLQAFPVFVLALALVATVGASSQSLIAAIAIVNVPVFARLVRSEVLTRKRSAFVEAAVLSGNRPIRLTLYHVFPNAMRTALVQLSVSFGFAILLTAGLSFVGAGVRVPTAEWGIMVAKGAPQMVTGEWWTVLFPGLALGLSVFGFSMISDGIARLLDPMSRL